MKKQEVPKHKIMIVGSSYSLWIGAFLVIKGEKKLWLELKGKKLINISIIQFSLYWYTRIWFMLWYLKVFPTWTLFLPSKHND